MAETQVEFLGLNEQDQLALDSFRSLHGQPILPRQPKLVGRRQNTKFLQDIAHLQQKLEPCLQRDAVLAMYNNPSNEKSTKKQYFCEACTVYLPAHQQDWQAHLKGVSHQCQLLSLCSEGELGHMPQGENCTSEVILTKQQLQHFGCHDTKRLHDLQLEAMMAVIHLAGPTSSRRIAPTYWNLSTDWAAMAMRLACAAKTQDKKLTIAFEASEVMCLAELLKQKQNLRSISVYGQQSDDCSLHVADAVALDTLLKALSNQTQLESIEIAFGGAILPDWEEDIASDMDSDEEAMIEAEAAEEVEIYSHVSAITAQMFHPAWTSVCRLLEGGCMFRLRCAVFRLPHHADSLLGSANRVEASVMRGFQHRKSAQVTAVLMGVHHRLGADSELSTLPQVVLRKIMQLALQPCTVQLYHVDSGILIKPSDGSHH